MSTALPGLAGTPDRLSVTRDRELIAEHYPGLRLEHAGSTSVITGKLALTMPDGEIEEVGVWVELAEDHPHHQPIAYDADERWTPELDRHILSDHSFCLFLARVDEPDIQGEAGILPFMRELEMFVRQQLILDSQRRFDPDARFPGPEWPHGNAAYALLAALLLDNEPAQTRAALWDAARFSLDGHEPCTCGSGRSHKKCHRRLCKRLHRTCCTKGNLGGLTYDQLLHEAGRDE
jgi:hypothetical protein